jgi:hypothetical protein
MVEPKRGTARLQSGDFAKVKAKEEIARTLDPLGKLDGCLFMNEMWDACGKEFVVVKEIKNFFDERRHRMYKPRQPVYILKGSICSGEVDEKGRRCDHSCHFLWHESWLNNT